MEDVYSLIINRRSVYPPQYNGNPISKESIEKILESANWAPTHRRTEPWRFKVFHSEEARHKLSHFFKVAYPKTVDNLSELKLRRMTEKPILSACVIAICFQRDPKESLPEWEEIAATAMAVQNMWLTATSLKIGAYWSSPALLNHFGDYFTLEPGQRCLGFFYLGHFDGEFVEGSRNTPIQAKTEWI